MGTRLLLLASLAAVVACSSSSSSSSSSGEPGPATPATCAPELPSELAVSEGGRVVVKVPAGVELVPSEGVVVTPLAGTEVSVRVPYGTTPSTLGTSCGREISISVRPLTWTKVAAWADGAGAPAREYGAFWLDETNAGGIVVFGGFHYVPKQFTPANDAWRFDFATNAWTALSGNALPTNPGGRVAKIPGARAVYQFGGQTEGPNGSAGTVPVMHRIEWDETTMRTQPVLIPEITYGSYTGAFVYDAKRSRWVAVCGADSRRGPHCEVATFREGEGMKPVVAAGTGPDARYGFHYVLDEENDRIVLFAGQGPGDEAGILGDTWSLELGSEPPRWKAIKTAGTAASKRRNGAYALDARGHRLFVWGGTPDGKASVKGIQALSLDRGSETWSDVTVAGMAPPERTSGLAVEDPARGRILFGFGNGRALYRDLWALDVGAPTVTSEASGDSR